MNKLKRNFFALAVAASLGLFGAVSAYAQGVAWQTTSLPRQVRGEGITETVGEVVLTATNDGTVVDESSIDFVYSTRIRNVPASGTAIALGSFVTCTPASVCDTATLTVVGINTLRLSFSGGDEAVVAGNTIVVSEVRLDANAGGVGPLTVTLSGVSALPAANPITFTEPIRTVASIVKPSLPVTDFDDVSILTCDPPESNNIANFFLEVTEAFPGAVASETEEENFSDANGLAQGVVTTGTTIIVELSGVPDGFIVTPVSIDSSEAGTTFGALPDDQEQTASNGAALTFIFEVTDTETGIAEEFTMEFNIGTEDGDPVPAGGLTGPVTATVRLGPITSTGIVRFANNSQGEEEVAIITDCQTRLLYSWIVNTAGYDTGIAIANTSEDDAAYDDPAGTAQNGPCVLTGYPASGGSPISFTTATIPAGQTLAFTMSGVTGFSGFSGYVLAVCNFLNAHSFFFITDGFGSASGPGLAQGGQALVVPIGDRADPDGESLGH